MKNLWKLSHWTFGDLPSLELRDTLKSVIAFLILNERNNAANWLKVISWNKKKKKENKDLHSIQEERFI